MSDFEPPRTQRITPAVRGRRSALDGIRALAVSLVILTHAQVPPFQAHAFGADVFFVLSGYLITTLLIDERRRSGSISFRRFYLRRFLRLMPTYYALVMVALVIQIFVPAGGTLRGVVSGPVYVLNWVAALNDGGLGYLQHTWSLSIEEQFYLVWPVALVLIWRYTRSGRGIPVAVTVSLIAVSVTDTTIRALHNQTQYVYYASDPRAFALLTGCLLAFLAGNRLTERPAVQVAGAGRQLPAIGVLAIAGIVTCSCLPSSSLVVTTAVLRPFVVLCAVGLILAALEPSGPIVALLSWSPVAALGRASYSAYLWNFPVLVVFDEEFRLKHHYIVSAMGILVSAVVAALSYRYLELPFLRLRSAYTATRGPARHAVLARAPARHAHSRRPVTRVRPAELDEAVSVQS